MSFTSKSTSKYTSKNTSNKWVRPFVQPIRTKLLHRVSTKNVRVSACLMQGWRKAMEDFHTISKHLSSDYPNTTMLTICDGHRGTSTNFLDKIMFYIFNLNRIQSCSMALTTYTSHFITSSWRYFGRSNNSYKRN